MFLKKANPPKIEYDGSVREYILVRITNSSRAGGLSGDVMFYRDRTLDGSFLQIGWKASNGFKCWTGTIKPIENETQVGNEPLVANAGKFGTVIKYSGFIPVLSTTNLLTSYDRGLLSVSKVGTPSEYCARIPNTGNLNLRPSMDHDMKDSNSRGQGKYIYEALMLQSLYDSSTPAHFTSYENAVERWESANGPTKALTLDTSYFYTSDGYSGVILTQTNYTRVKITGELYLSSPGTWEIWDYRDDASACDFGGNIGYINSPTYSWSRRASYTSTGDEWVPFTWYFSEYDGNDYWGIHIKGPNDSSHRDIQQSEMRYARDLLKDCNIPSAPELVFHMPLQEESTVAATGQRMYTEGSPVYEVIDGRKCVYLDGESFLYTEDTSNLPISNEGRIVCAWMRPQSGCNGDYVMSYGTSSSNRRYGFGVSDDGTELGAWGHSNTVLYPYNPTLNQWHHIMLLFIGNHEKLFVNGKLIASAEHRNLDTGSTHVCIGTGAGDFGHTFIGHVADVRIYKGVCNVGDIRKIYNACLR